MDTAEQTIDRVRTRLEDPGGVFFTTADYIRSFNDALDEISEQTEIRESTVYVKRRKMAVYTDLRGILPPGFLRITSIWNPQSGKWLDPTSERELDSTIGRFWEHNHGISRWWFMRGLWFLGAYPCPNDDASPLRIHFTLQMEHINEDSLTRGLASKILDIPPDFFTAIEFYMTYDLLTERKEVKKALEYYQMFQQQIPGLKDLAENRMRADRTPRMGARRYP
jgi:hypothetical protein